MIDRILPDLDLDAFWDDNEYALRSYVDRPPSQALILSVEAELGYRLPASYVAVMRLHNGGMPRNTCCPSPNRTTWAEDHVAVHGIMGIGREKQYSLAGDGGSRFWLSEWGGSVALGVGKIAARLTGEAVEPSPCLAASEVGVCRVPVPR
jgi:hypothetical protein